ncbi:MAG: EAL domain-containing protein, partial [Spirochaetota bacterium]
TELSLQTSGGQSEGGYLLVAKIEEKHNQKIVGTMVNLAESLDLEVVVEGIETKQQWDYFRGIKCSTLQGYHFSYPVRLEKLVEELSRIDAV